MMYPNIYFMEGNVPLAGKYALNHIHKHLHGVNHDSTKHCTSVAPHVTCYGGKPQVETVNCNGARPLTIRYAF